MNATDQDPAIPQPPATPSRKKPEERTETFLPPPQTRPDSLATFVRPVTAPLLQTSTVHFAVSPAMFEIIGYANDRGWLLHGWTSLSIQWQELHWTVDNWKTTKVLKSTDVPCPVVNAHFYLPNVPKGTEIEFALRVGVACHAPHDTAGVREVGELWFNNEGRNYRQKTK